MMYADTFMSEGEFREMFDHSLHDEVRRRYEAADAFPALYDKLKRSARH